MKIEFRCHYCSDDTKDSLTQVAESFEENFISENETKLWMSELEFEKTKLLNFASTLTHPIMFNDDKFKSEYSKQIEAYFLSGPIDYLGWVSANWRGRIQLHTSCMIECIAKLPKSKFDETFKSKLRSKFESAGKLAANNPPVELAKIQPVYLCRDKTGKCITISYAVPSAAYGWDIEAIEPIDAVKWVGKSPFQQESEVFISKFIRRGAENIEYREMWYDGEFLTTHNGVCGDIGETVSVVITDIHDLWAAKKEFFNEAKSLGFKEILDSALKYLVLEYDCTDDESTSILDRKNQMEDQFDQLIGWRGLGHLDGGSVSANSIEIALKVVDFDMAKKSICDFTRGTPLAGFSRIKKQ